MSDDETSTTPRKRPKVSGPSVSPSGARGAALAAAEAERLRAEEERLRRVADKVRETQMKPGDVEKAKKLVADALKKNDQKEKEEIRLLHWGKSSWEAWSECPDYSPIEGTQLIALKVPLSSQYELDAQGGKDSTRTFFTIDEFAEKCGPVLMVADSVPDSNEFVYNERTVFDDWDIDHLCLTIEADQKQGVSQEVFRFVVPSRAQVSKFIQAARRVWEEDELAKVGVISTYGYNRAGVFIVSYLVEEKKLTLKQALDRFAKSRPPGIYSKSCLLALQRRYAPNVPLDVPAAPAWDKGAISCGAAKATASQIPGSQETSKQAPQATHSKVAPQAPQAPPVAISDGLPPPWQKAYSNREKREYFFNPVTKKAVWKIEDCV